MDISTLISDMTGLMSEWLPVIPRTVLVIILPIIAVLFIATVYLPYKFRQWIKRNTVG